TSTSPLRRPQAPGTPLTVPRVAKLLAASAFRPLDDWLRQRQADVAEVQAAVAEGVDMGQPAALEQEEVRGTCTMPPPTNPPRPLADLLTELEAAISAGDRARATQLEQAILQRLASEAAERAVLERRVRALMAALDQH